MKRENMFFDSKFSILKAYVTSFKINLEYIAFYMIWQFIVWFIGTAFVIYLAVLMDILDPQALMQDYSWIATYFFKMFTDISIVKSKMSAVASGHEPYDILKIVFPENILNHTLENMTWSEYWHVILMPKKIILILIGMILSIFAMTTSVGYLKTALKFQSGQKASLHDMYQHFHVVPQYFLGKMIILGVFLLPLIPFLGSLNLALIIAMVVLAIFMYQRLRFMQYFIVDKGVTVFTAFKASWKATNGTVFHLCIYSIVSSLLFMHPGTTVLILLFALIYKQADVNIYKQMIE